MTIKFMNTNKYYNIYNKVCTNIENFYKSLDIYNLFRIKEN
jgi:hypothetical protein